MSDQTKRMWLAGGSTVVIVLAAAWLVVGHYHDPGRKVRQALGQAMAEQTAKIAGNGGRVVILTADPKTSPAIQREVEAFREAASRRAGLTILGIDTVKSYEMTRSGALTDFAGA